MMNIKDYVLRLLEEHPNRLDHIKRIEYEIRNFKIPDMHSAYIENNILSNNPGERIHANRIADKTANLAVEHYDEYRAKLLSLYKTLGKLKNDADRLEYNLSIIGDPYSTVVRLFYFEKLTWPEIQGQLNRGLRTLKTYRTKCVDRLTEAYSELIQLGVIEDKILHNDESL